MTSDYPAALAAAREAENERSAKVCELLTCDEADTRRLSGEVSVLDRHCAHRLRDLLAALDAQVPDGRIHQDGFFSWAGTSESEHRQKDRLLPCDFYLAPVAPAAATQNPKEK